MFKRRLGYSNMKCLKVLLISIFWLQSICEVKAQQTVEVPTPEYYYWPCYYINGKQQTWNLEKHSSITATSKNVLKMDWSITLIGSAKKNTLEGNTSGVIINYNDEYAFLFKRKSGEDYKKLTLYKLNTGRDNRTFREDDDEIVCNIEKTSENTERIIPVNKLKNGEYAFLYDCCFAFTFKIID